MREVCLKLMCHNYSAMPIIRVMQSSFLVSFRISCTHRLARSTRVRPETSSSRGGSSFLGEMEVTQLMASGIVSDLDEFNISSDVVCDSGV